MPAVFTTILTGPIDVPFVLFCVVRFVKVELLLDIWIVLFVPKKDVPLNITMLPPCVTVVVDNEISVGEGLAIRRILDARSPLLVLQKESV